MKEASAEKAPTPMTRITKPRSSGLCLDFMIKPTIINIQAAIGLS